ncbi:hypothetical protein IQ07DRAFT_584802 [Pyrenochaeta sp. DS3sAY3a]|nr:hypothetical protein IQ07DRAFT_584802 [Pyrenochaeta sp. DS3sAY3a]
MATSSSPPVYTGPSVSLHVSITVAPENAQKLLELFQPCYEAVTAIPECVFFEVFQDPDTPGKFRFVENWNASRDWIFDVLLKKDLYKPYEAATKPLWIEPRKIEIWERLPGRPFLTVKQDMIITGKQ